MNTRKTITIVLVLAVASVFVLPAISNADIEEKNRVVIVEEDIEAVEKVKTVEKVEVVDDKTRCRITFDLKGWSVFYRRAKGEGVIRCDNGQTANVRLSAHGGGITFGKQEITDGSGSFTKVKDISKLFGSYANSEAHAGASKSADAQALTKGKVSLAFSGTGKGYDLGFSFGALKITPVQQITGHAANPEGIVAEEVTAEEKTTIEEKIAE